MLRTFTLAALVSSAAASSWGAHHHDHMSIVTPHLPPLLAGAMGSGVWAPAYYSSSLLDSKPQSKRKSDGSVELTFRKLNSFPYGQYATTLFIGTPPQPVKLPLFVSGSEVMAINHKLDGHHFYDHAKSSTYKANGTWFHYGDVISGFSSRDVITFGDPDTKHTIHVDDFLLLELKGQDDTLQHMQGDGGICLGPSASTVTGAPSIVREMIRQKALDEPVVGIYADEHNALVMFGGIDSLYVNGAISYFPLPKGGVQTWSVPVSGVSVDGKPVTGSSSEAQFQYSNFIVGPYDAAEKIADAVGVDNGVLPCNGTGPNITFAIGNDLHVTLTKDDYAILTPQDNVCLFAFMGIKNFDRWSLGNQFLSKVYLVLDFGESEEKSRTGIALSQPRPF